MSEGLQFADHGRWFVRGMGGQIRQPRTAIGTEKDAARLRRRVRDILAGEIAEPFRGDAQDFQARRLIQLPPAGGEFGESLAFDVFIRVKNVTAGFPGFIHGLGGRVLHVRLGPRVGDEARARVRIVGVAGIEDFQRDGPIDGGLHRGIDGSPAGVPEFPDDLVGADRLADQPGVRGFRGGGVRRLVGDWLGRGESYRLWRWRGGGNRADHRRDRAWSRGPARHR